MASGVKLNLGCGPAVLDGFENLDAATGWRFEDGLPYADATVAVITISHALMYVPLAEWPAVFADLARVLEPGGIVRVTEDDTEEPESERFGGWHDAITLTAPELVMGHLADAGLAAFRVGMDETLFRDRSLIQQLHGAPPKVFAVEGRKLDGEVRKPSPPRKRASKANPAP